MPAYMKKSKYSDMDNQEMRVQCLGVLQDAVRPMTIDEIRNSDLNLALKTSQKIARILNELAEAGFATKGKDPITKKVTYRIVCT